MFDCQEVQMDNKTHIRLVSNNKRTKCLTKKPGALGRGGSAVGIASPCATTNSPHLKYHSALSSFYWS